MGDILRESPNYIDVLGSDILVHSGYDPISFHNDIALIKTRTITFSGEFLIKLNIECLYRKHIVKDQKVPNGKSQVLDF